MYDNGCQRNIHVNVMMKIYVYFDSNTKYIILVVNSRVLLLKNTQLHVLPVIVSLRYENSDQSNIDNDNINDEIDYKQQELNQHNLVIS
ncbi:unnamed protein product [Rotaria socialis]